MSTSIAQNIEALCQEQGIDRDLVIEAIKEAVRAAAKKQFKGGEDIQVDWSSDTGLEISASKVVVDEVADPFTELSIDEARELGVELRSRYHISEGLFRSIVDLLRGGQLAELPAAVRAHRQLVRQSPA